MVANDGAGVVGLAFYAVIARGKAVGDDDSASVTGWGGTLSLVTALQEMQEIEVLLVLKNDM